MNKETAQRLFNFMRKEYLVELTETDMQDIERILSEGKKARKHNSPKLQEILDEVTPSEMEEKKAEMQGKTEEEENFYCAEWNKVGFRCDVGQCEKCAKEEGKTPLKGWISVEERLPEDNQLVWGWDGKSTIFMWCRVYDKSEGWFQAISYGQPYGENGKIVADCEIEDIDVKYWQPLPELKLGEGL